MTLDEFMNTLIKANNPEDQDSFDYEALAFDAGVEFAIKKIKEFLDSEIKENQKVTLTEYLKILNALSQNRKDEEFEDRDTSWQEAGYQSALFDVREYLDNNEMYINNILNEFKKLEED